MNDRQTNLVRIRRDLAGMLGDIADVTNETIADMIDPLIRGYVEQKHASLKATIKVIKAARLKHQTAKVG